MLSHWQEAEFFKAKAERQAELLGKAELARMEAERERARMEAKFARTEKGVAMLDAVRLKLELQACRERLTELEMEVRLMSGTKHTLDLSVTALCGVHAGYLSIGCDPWAANFVSCKPFRTMQRDANLSCADGLHAGWRCSPLHRSAEA